MRKGQHFARTFKRAVAVEYSQFYPRASEHQSIRASFVIFTFYSNKKGEDVVIFILLIYIIYILII